MCGGDVSLTEKIVQCENGYVQSFGEHVSTVGNMVDRNADTYTRACFPAIWRERAKGQIPSYESCNSRVPSVFGRYHAKSYGPQGVHALRRRCTAYQVHRMRAMTGHKWSGREMHACMLRITKVCTVHVLRRPRCSGGTCMR